MYRLVLLIMSLMPSVLYAHGGVSMKDDMCVIKLGSYKAHFSAYMPKLRGTQEFCESLSVREGNGQRFIWRTLS